MAAGLPLLAKFQSGLTTNPYVFTDADLTLHLNAIFARRFPTESQWPVFLKE
jgi:hypothetical protein